jgi:hypothetical protein
MRTVRKAENTTPTAAGTNIRYTKSFTSSP